MLPIRTMRLLAAIFAVTISAGACLAKPGLRFRADGSFTIVQFTDTQDDERLDPRTTAAMEGVLDREKPDLVVITGDCVDTGQCATADELRRAIDSIAQPMESRKIAWAVVFGNHDHDNIAKLGISQEAMLALYMQHRHNVNRQDSRQVYGAGNAVLLVKASNSEQPAFAVWLLNSNAYAPSQIAGQKLGGYDWVRPSQVQWYRETSLSLEKRAGGKVAGLMFFHIPLPEFDQAVTKDRVTSGEVNEWSGASALNSGLFVAALERGDIKGMFAGHAHINTGVANWYGITLGYGGSVGYGTYGFAGDEAARNRLRGGRVFEITEHAPASFRTRYVTVGDLTAQAK